MLYILFNKMKYDGKDSSAKLLNLYEKRNMESYLYFKLWQETNIVQVLKSVSENIIEVKWNETKIYL